MNISVATDFNGSTGKAENSLRQIAEAGFTHLHWCHQWCTDFLYSDSEIEQIGIWLKTYGLKLLDIHGSQGQEKYWCSTDEYTRRAGVELVANRIKMMRALEGTGAVMMHIPVFRAGVEESQKPIIRKQIDAFRRSMDQLIPELQKAQTMIAIENMWTDTWEIMFELLNEYPADLLGICYDSGHANSNGLKQMDFLEKGKQRLAALHLHDNNGEGDQHLPPFYGTVDWERLAQIIGTSGYSREISFEMSIANSQFRNPDDQVQGEEACRNFLKDAYERCSRFTAMVDKYRCGN